MMDSTGAAVAGPIAVLGAGSWGTSIAWLLGRKGYSVRLWAREQEVVESINEVRENTVFLPDVTLSESIRPTTSLEEAVAGTEAPGDSPARLIVSVVPSHGLGAVFETVAPHIEDGTVVVSATKGVEEATLMTPSGIIAKAIGQVARYSFVALSGPTFAREVSAGLPAAICAASDDSSALSLVQDTFTTPVFRVYTNTDVTGVEIGGALKNVVAIASGISDGLGLGHNARAALITRGLAEISRLGVAMGADALTFAGLSGMGDLVLTCTGPLSRNYTLGVKAGQGMTLEEITGEMRMVAEGVKTSRAAKRLAEREGVEMPITDAVYSVLHDGKGPAEAVTELMARDLRSE